MSEEQVIITLKIMEADVPTKNGRIYPRKVLEDALERYKEKLGPTFKFDAIGEFAFSDAPSSANLNFGSISHGIKNIRFENNDLVGEVVPLNTPQGLVLSEYIKQKVPLGLASRGYGTSSEGVISDYSFVSIDIVSESAVSHNQKV